MAKSEKDVDGRQDDFLTSDHVEAGCAMGKPPAKRKLSSVRMCEVVVDGEFKSHTCKVLPGSCVLRRISRELG